MKKINFVGAALTVSVFLSTIGEASNPEDEERSPPSCIQILTQGFDEYIPFVTGSLGAGLGYIWALPLRNYCRSEVDEYLEVSKERLDIASANNPLVTSGGATTGLMVGYLVGKGIVALRQKTAEGLYTLVEKYKQE